MSNPVTNSESEVLSQGIYEYLTEGVGVTLPDIDLDDPKYNYTPDEKDPINSRVLQINTKDLTTGDICGDGVFDVLMSTYSKHITNEYDKGRITGTEYANAYVQLTSTAMSQSIQFLLGKDQAYWSALLVQAQAKNAAIAMSQAQIGLAIAKLQAGIAAGQLEHTKAEYALMKMRLSSEDANYELLVKQKDVVDIDIELKDSELNVLRPLQVSSVTMDNNIKQYNLEEIMPVEKELLNKQVESITRDNNLKEYDLDVIKPLEVQVITTDKNIKTYSLEEIMPVEKQQLEKQIEAVDSEINLKKNELTLLRPLQGSILESQLVMSETDVSIKEYQLANILPAEKSVMEAQVSGIETDNSLKDHELTVMRPLAVTAAGTDNSMKIYQLEHILPVEKLHLESQTSLVENQSNKVSKDIEAISFDIEEMLPKQRDILVAQEDQILKSTNKIEADTRGVTYNTDFILPAQKSNIESDTRGKDAQVENLIPAQVLNTQADTSIKTYTHSQILPIQKDLTKEQMEAKRAETLETRTDGAVVKGSVGKQKDLYAQQITSYKRDSEIKTGRLLMDSWITQKGLDEGLVAPPALQNTSVDTVIKNIISNNELTE